MIPSELMPLKGTRSLWAISSEDVKSDEKVHWVTSVKPFCWYTKATTRIHISHLATWINRKTLIKAKGFILWTDKIVFSDKFVCFCNSCKIKIGDFEQPIPRRCGCTANRSWFFGIGKAITFPILACCMLFAICMLLQFSLSLLFPSSKHRKGAAFLVVLLFFWRCVQPSKCQRQTTKRGGKKGIASGSARHYQNRITSSCAALAVWPVDQGNQTIFTHSKQNGWCGIKRKLLWKRWED